eukprot:scaffold1754_cov180-Ochromonas_danica.AAC.31
MGVSMKELQKLEHQIVYDLVLQAANPKACFSKTPEVNQNIGQQNANILYSLSKMGERYPSISGEVRGWMEDCLLKSAGDVNNQNIANVIYSLGVMKTSWMDLDPCLQDKLYEAILTVLPSMTKQNLSVTLYGLSLSHVKWTDLPMNMRQGIDKLLRTLFTESTDSNRISQSLSNILYSLGVMSAEWTTFTPQARSALLDALRDHITSFSSQHLSMTLYGLGGMSVPFKGLDKNVVESFRKFVKEQQSTLTKEGVGSMLNGARRMAKSWNDVPLPIREVLFEAVAKLREYDPVCLALTIDLYSFGQLGLHWSKLPTLVSERIMKELIQQPLSGQSLCNTLYGLGSMQVRWFNLQEEVRRALLVQLASPTAFPENNPHHFSSSILSLAKMGAIWKDLPRVALETALLRVGLGFTDKQLSNTIYSLGIMDANWDDLSLDVLKMLVKVAEKQVVGMSTLGLANMMFATSMVVFDSDCKIPVDNVVDETKKQKISLLWKLHHW